MKQTVRALAFFCVMTPATAFAAPITFDLRDPTIELIDEVNSFSLTLDGLTATLQASPQTYNGTVAVLNQTSSSFGINVLNTSCGSLEDSAQVDGGCGGESLQISFDQDVLLNSLRLSSFGTADEGLVTIDDTTEVSLLNTGLHSLSNVYLFAGDVWTIGYVKGNGFSVDNFTVTSVPEPASLLLLTVGAFGVALTRRFRRQ